MSGRRTDSGGRPEILVACRDVTRSSVALELAVQLSLRMDAQLSILAVIRHDGQHTGARRALDQALEIGSKRLGADRCRTALRVGHPAEEILQELDERSYALVVVGDREYQSRLERLVLGSTAERIIEHAPCAVAVAKGRVGPVRRLMLCDSGVAEAALVDLMADRLPALLLDAEEVRVVHVVSHMSAGPSVTVPSEGDPHDAGKAADPKDGHGLDRATERLVERNRELLDRMGVRATMQVRHGIVVEEIVSAAQSGRADLVVIGANRGDGWRRVLLGDLARDIFRRLRCPVLVVRP